MKAQNILFYDGDCGFCNRWVQFVLKWEKKPEIHFATLQSDFAKSFFIENKASEPNLNSFYFYTNHYFHWKSNAFFTILPFLKFPLPLLKIFIFIPICYRDKIYDYIARNRHKISKKQCVIPTQNQKERFL